MPTIVALDIETTGLDPHRDAIIEIGAVRFNGRRIEAKWETLINPGRSVPPFITQLTGISNNMVANAPKIREVLQDLVEFVGDAPVISHRVSFDLSFIRRQNILLYNDNIDTYDMAAVLLPTIERYNLGALAQSLRVIPPGRGHRGLNDALMTHGVYLRLHDLALDLPIDLLAEIVRLSEPLEWGGHMGFRLALQERTRETVGSRPASQQNSGPWFGEKPARPPVPLEPNSSLCALDSDEVAAVLEHGGAFSQHFPHFEYRPEQVEMLRAVTQALSQGRHLMVEAGTGVGKSIAYLIPAALWALQNNIRVVVSTNTINLQEQLIHKDIPDLCTALGVPLNAVVLKGRSNYLCPRRLETFRRKGPENSEEMRILAKVMVWRLNSGSGDRSEINLNGQIEREVWLRISAEDEGCTTENCIQRSGGNCPFLRVRQAAQSAHILIVNHALLLADVATGNRVLPEYDYLIIDEAHHLEAATTNALSFSVNQYDVERLIHELGSPRSGALGWLLTIVSEALSPQDLEQFTQLVHRATDLAFQVEELMRRFFDTLNRFLYDMREGREIGSYGHQERILPATRRQPAWGEVEMEGEQVLLTLHTLLDILVQLGQGLTDLLESLPEDGLELLNRFSNLYRRFNEIGEQLQAAVFKPQLEQIYWAEIQPNGRNLSLHVAPLHIGELMQRYLWHEKSSVILTSATLTAANEFDYLRNRLFAEDADELALGSPFDYESAALIYIPSDIPEPSDRHGYQRAMERSLIQLCRATGGKTLVLFTSYAHLKATAQAVGPILGEDEILVYEQGEGASPHALLETFRTADKAVLLGTRAFWEGVDLPGEALSVLVIAKLPFDVPSDPIVAARSETFEDPFNQYQLPEAVLRFRQGFGRLIRSQSDRGVVAILDRRILSKRYGQAFLESLPACTTEIGPLALLPRSASRWLNL